MGPDVIRELDGLRALARALVAGGADADDLVQDAAVIALEHPPELDRPVRPWLARVLRNRRRMDVRGARRRELREQAVAVDPVVEPADTIDRARVLERLSQALVALDEPFRTAVVRRYLDGESAADIARALGVPAGTVRWRVKTGLDRLRAALDDSAPKWRIALVPIVKGAVLVKVKTQIAWLVLLLLIAGGGAWFALHRGDKPAPAPAAQGSAHLPLLALRAGSAAAPPLVDPLPGQGRVAVADDDAPGGMLRGRVINWSTGEGVGGAELTFAGDAGAVTIRSRDDGAFELAPPAPGDFTLATISAPGFLPYAPEYEHSQIHIALAPKHAVRGLTVFLFPALDYHGKVVDNANAPVAGAKVRLLGTPQGEQTIESLASEWTSARDGTFTFHAADYAVFEAQKGVLRGWARLDGDVTVTRQLVIKLGPTAARDATITGHVVDDDGHPLPDVLVRALPKQDGVGYAASAPPRATAATTSGPDGRFTLEHLDRDPYELLGELEGRAGGRALVDGGAKDVTLTIPVGIVVAGTVVTTDHAPVPAFTIAVYRRAGAQRGFEVARSIVDAQGRFTIHVAPGDIELVASASGLAPAPPKRVAATAPVAGIELVLSIGGTLRGTVVDAADHSLLAWARVMREARGDGPSAQPGNAGTVTRKDGTFELTGIPAGPVSITIGAGEYNPRIEGGMTATDGETIGPITIGLTKLAPGEQPKLELVGIGVALAAQGDMLVVNKVIPGSGAEAAGIVQGDMIAAVDGVASAELGVDGAVARIRGAEGTTVAITLKRGDALVQLVVMRKKLRA